MAEKASEPGPSNTAIGQSTASTVLEHEKVPAISPPTPVKSENTVTSHTLAATPHGAHVLPIPPLAFKRKSADVDVKLEPPRKKKFVHPCYTNVRAARQLLEKRGDNARLQQLETRLYKSTVLKAAGYAVAVAAPQDVETSSEASSDTDYNTE